MKSAALLGQLSGASNGGVLAHQGGWDEILLVVGPLAVVAGLLWLANKRVSKQLEAAQAESDSPSDAPGEHRAEPGESPNH